MASDPAPWWKDYPWRLIQTNLREIDMQDIDARVYVDSLKKMHATVAMINAAGIIASYPTDLPYHFQSPYLTGDSLETIIAACHDAGIKVIARTDFSKVREEIHRDHPEWACRYQDGRIENYNGDVHVCINSGYARKYSLEIIKEVLTKHDFDGIFFNMGGYVIHNYSHDFLGICRCDGCRTGFKDRYGLDLPDEPGLDTEAGRKYQLFKMQTVEEHRQLVVETIKSVRPKIAIDKNWIDETGFTHGECNTEIDRPLPHWQYAGSDTNKVMATSWPDVISGIATVDFIGFPYRHVAVSPAQQELRLWQAVANCGQLDYYLIGPLDNHRDRSGWAGIERVFAFHKEHYRDTLKGLAPDGDILLVSQHGNLAEYRGWFRMLTENHFLFEAVRPDRIGSLDLAKYQAVILPEIKYLDDGTCRQLDVYAEAGGLVIASGETAFCNEQFEKRDQCGLRCLGIKSVNEISTSQRSAMLAIDQRDLFPSMSDRDLLYFGDTFIFAEYEKETEGLLHLIPVHNFGPPERCYWTEETDMPGVLIHAHGTGKGVHIPWLPGQLFYREGYDNTPVFISDLLHSVCKLPKAGGNLPPMVEINRSVNKAEGYTLLQLVNMTGHFGNSFYPPVPLADRTISVPCADNPVKVTLPASGQDVPFDYSTGWLTVRLEHIGFYEAVKIFHA